MFDYIYTDIKGTTVKEMLSNSLLDFVSPISTTTGEINPYNRERQKRGLPHKYVMKSDFKGLTLKVTNQRYINLEGSLHEFAKGNNYLDFSRAEVKQAINSIAAALNVNPVLMPLHNVEFGINVELPFPVSTFLDSILCCKGQRPERSIYNGGGCQIRFTFNQYGLKFYDKGKQYNLSSNLLRVEISVTTMQYLQAKGLDITTLNDLCNGKHYRKLKTLLLNAIDSLIVNDCYPHMIKLTKPEKSLLIQCNNPLYWFDLWNINQDNYRKKKIKFRDFNDKYGKEKLQTTVYNLVGKKWEELAEKTGTEISSLQLTQPINKSEQFLTTGTDISIKLIDNIRSIGLPVLYCKSCGRDISNQKPGSVFCSEKLFGKQGKKCRNLDSNPRNNFLKRETINTKKGLLFDTTSLIKDERLRELICK